MLGCIDVVVLNCTIQTCFFFSPLPLQYAIFFKFPLARTLPRAAIVAATDLTAAVAFWDAVLDAHHSLAAPPYGTRRERLVVDTQVLQG